MIEPDGAWLRPATKMEWMFNILNEKGCSINCYQITLNSSEEITENQFRDAFLRLFGKVPILRVCFRTPDDDEELWIKEMDESKIDFKWLENEIPYEVSHSLIHKMFDIANGPLWRARVVTVPDNVVDDCPEPDFELEFPNQYHILISIHHGISDGYTMLKVCSLYRELLQDVIAERDSSFEVLGDFSNGEETEDIITLASEYLNSDQELLYNVNDVLRPKGVPTILKLIPNYEIKALDVETRSIHHRFDEGLTEQFRQKCKIEKVTLNSAFSSAINAALIFMINDYIENGKINEILLLTEHLDSGETLKYCNIKGEHYVDMRQYWNESQVNQLGCHITLTTLSAKTSKDVMLDFWGYARNYHQMMENQLKKDCIAFHEAAMWLSQPEGTSMKEHVNSFVIPFCSFRLANLGDITKNFPESKDKVQVSNFSMSTSIHKTNVVTQHVIFTYRGRLSYGIDFSTRYVPLELAEELMSKVVAIVETEIC